MYEVVYELELSKILINSTMTKVFIWILSGQLI